MHQTSKAHGTLLAESLPLDRLHPDLQPATSQAMACRERDDHEFDSFLNSYLEPPYQSLAGEKLSRLPRLALNLE